MTTICLACPSLMYLATASNVLLSKLSGGTLSSMGDDVSWPIFVGNQAPPLPFAGWRFPLESGWRCGLCLRPMVDADRTCVERAQFLTKIYEWIVFAMRVDG